MVEYIGSDLAAELMAHILTIIDPDTEEPQTFYAGFSSNAVSDNAELYLAGESDEYYRQEVTLVVSEDDPTALVNTEDIIWFPVGECTIASFFISNEAETNQSPVLFANNLADTYTLNDGSGLIVRAGKLVIKYRDDLIIWS